VVVVEEAALAHRPEHGQEIEGGDPLRGRESGDPFLHAGRLRAGELHAEGKHSQAQPRAVRLHLAAKLPELLEEARERVAHVRGLGGREELLHVVDLAAPRAHQAAHQRGPRVQGLEQRWGPGEVVVDLGDVVEADRDHHVVGMVAAADALVGDAFLARGPAAEGHVEDLGLPAARVEEVLQHLRVGLLRTQPIAEGDAVAEDHHAPDAGQSAQGMFAVAHAVAVVVLPGRPARGRGLDGVELAVVPHRDVAGHRARRRLVVEETAEALEPGQEEDDRRQAERDVGGEAPRRLSSLRRRSGVAAR
jgi:hypothetical protein